MSTITVGFLRTVAVDAQVLGEAVRAGCAFAGVGDVAEAEWGAALLDLAATARHAARLLEARPAPNEIESDRALVKRLLAVEGGFSEWEVNFVESISRWVETQALTPAQRNRAEQLDGR